MNTFKYFDYVEKATLTMEGATLTMEGATLTMAGGATLTIENFQIFSLC